MRVHQVDGIWSNLTCISTNHFDLCNQTTPTLVLDTFTFLSGGLLVAVLTPKNV